MVTDCVAIEEIQSQNWQYFVESVFDACRETMSVKKLTLSKCNN